MDSIFSNLVIMYPKISTVVTVVVLALVGRGLGVLLAGLM